jgi:hypothetical protein
MVVMPKLKAAITTLSAGLLPVFVSVTSNPFVDDPATAVTFAIPKIKSARAGDMAKPSQTKPSASARRWQSAAFTWNNRCIGVDDLSKRTVHLTTVGSEHCIPTVSFGESK